MHENYLYQIWKTKRIPFHKLKLVSGEEFILLHQGIHNNESGPDFFCGKVKIDNLIWAGNIEIHVKSSDWYLHKHQLNKAYNNVILHVVLENDKQVIINNRELPTIELKDHIDLTHFSNRHGFKKNDFNCSQMIRHIDSIYLESMKNKVIIERLKRKSQLIDYESAVSFGQVLFVFIANAFGNKVNTTSFFELSQQLSIKILKRIHKEDINVVILGVSGFYEMDEVNKNEKLLWEFYKMKYDLKTMNFFQWKSKGLHSNGFPIQRMNQLSAFVQNFEFNLDFIHNTAEEIINFINNLFNFNKGKIKFSKSFIELIIINGFVPFIWWYSIKINDLTLNEKCLEILEILNSEKNSIIKKWANIGVECKKAIDSQALLEIYNQFCNNKRCLSCSVGNKILNVGE